MQDLLDAIDAHFGYPKPDRKHERWVLCPFHGDRRVGSFSFSERGYLCFACGAKGNLRQLAQHLGLDTSAPLPILPRRRIEHREPTPIVRDWQRDPKAWRRYLPIPEAARLYYRRRGMSDESIACWRLGYGVLPSSRCRFPRYILPVFEDGELVALRGRITWDAKCPEEARCETCPHAESNGGACRCERCPHNRVSHPKEDCGPTRGKWLCAGGSKTVLFGTETLAPGRPVIVTEAPYSAILAVQEAPHLAAVASTAPAHWDESFTRRIVEAEPSWCLVWLDHDEAGEKNGQRVYEALKRAGLKVRRYRWSASAAEKCDLADEIASGRLLPFARRRADVLKGYPDPLNLVASLHGGAKHPEPVTRDVTQRPIITTLFCRSQA
jgi:hypothetical protein